MGKAKSQSGKPPFLYVFGDLRLQPGAAPAAKKKAPYSPESIAALVYEHLQDLPPLDYPPPRIPRNAPRDERNRLAREWQIGFTAYLAKHPEITAKAQLQCFKADCAAVLGQPVTLRAFHEAHATVTGRRSFTPSPALGKALAPLLKASEKLSDREMGYGLSPYEMLTHSNPHIAEFGELFLREWFQSRVIEAGHVVANIVQEADDYLALLVHLALAVLARGQYACLVNPFIERAIMGPIKGQGIIGENAWNRWVHHASLDDALRSRAGEFLQRDLRKLAIYNVRAWIPYCQKAVKNALLQMVRDAKAQRRTPHRMMHGKGEYEYSLQPVPIQQFGPMLEAAAKADARGDPAAAAALSAVPITGHAPRSPLEISIAELQQRYGIRNPHTLQVAVDASHDGSGWKQAACARRLGITKDAVWRCVRALRENPALQAELRASDWLRERARKPRK